MSAATAEFWSAFRDAVSKPTLAGVCAIVLLAGLQFGAIVVWLTPERLATSPHGLWMNDPWDHPAYVTLETLRLQRADPDELGVVIVGSSSMRHVLDDPDAFPERVAQEVGEPVRLYFLPAGGQSVWESALILDYLPDDFAGTVVIGVHPGRAVYDESALAEWARTPRLGLRSDRNAALAAQLGVPTKGPSGFYFLDHMGFISARRTAIVRNMLLGPSAYEHHGRRIDEPPSPEARAIRDSGAAEVMAHWETSGARGAQALQELVARLAARGTQVIVAFSPFHPNAEALHPEAFARFRRMIGEAATNGGAAVVDLNERARLAPADFRDVFHVNADGSRQRIETVLIDELRRSLRGARATGTRAKGEVRS